MNNLFKSLLGFANPRPGAVDANQPHLQSLSPAQWQALINLVHHHRVAGLAARHIDLLPKAARDAGADEAFRAAYHRTKLRHLQQVQQGQAVIQAFTQAGLACVPLKGFDLSRRYYADPGHRPFDDIDLLVPRHQVPAALDQLAALGFQRPDHRLPDALVRRLHFHIALQHPDSGTLLELHWRLVEKQTLPRDIDPLIWPHLTPGPLGYPILPPALYAAYLAIHLAKHGLINGRLIHHPQGRALALHPWSGNRLIWAVDLVHVVWQEALTRNQLLEAARELGDTHRVQETLALIARWFPGQIQPVTSVVPRPQSNPVTRRVEERLIARMEPDLDGESPGAAPLPWFLLPNRLTHVRPIRLISQRPTPTS